MNLEQRVQALEQELQILKHQIQATLLDIREQLLNNTYPELRAENAPPTQPTGPISAQPSSGLTDSSPVKQVSLSTVKPVPEDTNSDNVSLVNVRRISLEDIASDLDEQQHPAQRVNPRWAADNNPNDTTRPTRPAPTQSIYSHQTAFNAAPEKPANTYPTRSAPERPTVDPGFFDDLEADYRYTQPPANQPSMNQSRSHNDDTLYSRPVRRVTLDNMEYPPRTQPFSTNDKDEPPFVTQTELITQADWATLEMLENWVGRKVQQFGTRHTRELIKAYAAQGRFDIRMKGALLQLVEIISMEDPPLAGSTPPVLPTTPKKRAASDEEEEPPQTTILRLIAGIQNAGTNTGRRKPRG